jgi:hypothetical protein
MFATHASAISNYGRASPEAFARVLMFVVLTIRQPLYRTPSDMAKVDQQGLTARSVLFGFKKDAYKAIERDAERHWNFCEQVFENATLSNQQQAACMIEHLAELPGLGVVKAGFVVQLIYGLAGCLDSHNLARYNIKPTTFSNYKQRSPSARRKLCERYVKTVYDLGGPEELWDTWCGYIATKQPKNYRDAYHVSAIHCEALQLN